MRMALLAERILAAEALQWGLVTAVYPADSFDAEVNRLLATLVTGRGGDGKTTEAVNVAGLTELEAALECEKHGQSVLLESPDFVEGAAAFQQRRTPRIHRLTAPLVDESGTAEARMHARREQRTQTVAGRCHGTGDKQIVVEFQDLGRTQRPRLMLVGHPPGAARLAGVRTPSRGEPNLKWRRLDDIANADCEPAGQSAPRPAPHALVREEVTGPGHPHPRPRVRDTEPDPGERDNR